MTTIALAALALGAFGGAWQQVPPDDLQTLALHCRTVFGNEFDRRQPPDIPSKVLSHPLKHSATLRRLQVETDRLMGPDAKSNDRLLHRWLDNLADAPSDSETLFRLAYGCARATVYSGFAGDTFWGAGQHPYWNMLLEWMLAEPLEEDLQRQRADSSFEWLRLRFVIESALRDRASLIPLGRRLLAEDPGDVPIMRSLVTQLSGVMREAESMEAIRICEDGIRRWPQSALSYTAEGYVYFERWVSASRREDAEKLLRLDRTALALLPPHATEEAGLRRMVGVLRKMACRAPVGGSPGMLSSGGKNSTWP